MKKKSSLLFFAIILSLKGIAQDSISEKSKADSAAESKIYLNLGLNSYLQSEHQVTWSPSVSLRYDHLKLDLRYNYEALQTATVAGGYEFEGGDKTWYSITPMFGFSFGNYTGVSPELMTAFGTGNFVFTLDGEYSVSLTKNVSNLFLLWSGAYYLFNPWLFGGITLQRSRIFTPLNDIDAGVAIGVAPGALEFIFQANRFWDSSRYFQLGLSYFFNPQKSDRKHIAPSPEILNSPEKN